MVATTNSNFANQFISTAAGTVDTTVQQFQQLSADDQLAVLWFVYLQTGKSITPAAEGSSRIQLAQGLLEQVKSMSHQEQLQFMRDLVNNVNTPASRSYSILSANTKLAFWYRLAAWMEDGTIIPMPNGYQMSQQANQVMATLQRLEFNQQITILRRVVMSMGVDAL